MDRKKIYIFLLPIMVGFIISQGVNANSGPSGSSTNPVIAKSYANKVFQPLKDQIALLQGEVAILKEKASGQTKPKFTDVPSTHWAYSEIQLMVEKGVISGLGGGKFGPNNPARRSELAVMLVKALKLPTAGGTADFKDVPRSHWAYAEIAAAKKAGIISGFPGGRFEPNDYVSRGQMATMLVNAYTLQRNNNASDFKDVPKSYWAYDAIQKLADNSITKGFEDQTYRPAAFVKRAEVAVFLAKAIDPARRN